MHWIHLTDECQLNNVIVRSQAKTQVIFKHNTSCSISDIAFKRLQKVNAPADIDFYFINLLAHRNISNRVTQLFHVDHESPQVLIIKDGECVYDKSHLNIRMADILEHASMKCEISNPFQSPHHPVAPTHLPTAQWTGQFLALMQQLSIPFS